MVAFSQEKINRKGRQERVGASLLARPKRRAGVEACPYNLCALCGLIFLIWLYFCGLWQRIMAVLPGYRHRKMRLKEALFNRGLRGKKMNHRACRGESPGSPEKTGRRGSLPLLLSIFSLCSLCSLWFLSLIFIAPFLEAQETWWDRNWKCRREVTAYGPLKTYPGDDAAVVEFYTAGYAQKNGGDIRVIGGGKEVPYKVLYVGKGDFVSLVFRLQRGLNEYQIYFGNPKAKPARYNWEPQRGVLMETRRLRGSIPANFTQMQNLLRENTQIYGRGFVPKIFQGHNPFGPTWSYLATYTAWLYIAQGGEYSFATTSSHASFLVIDGKLVVQWPGKHRPVADARKRALIHLSPGLHKLEYYHTHSRGRAAAVAAWKPPYTGRMAGQPKFTVIPARAFAPVSHGRVSPLEILGESLVPDFTPLSLGEAPIDPEATKFAVRMKMLLFMPIRAKTAFRPGWDFGDGLTSREREPEHIYLSSGTYAITLTINAGGREYATTHKVMVGRDWGRQVERKVDSLKDYYPVVKGYDFKRLKPQDAALGMELFQRIKKFDDLITAGRALLGRRDLPENILFEKGFLLGEVYEKEKKFYPQAAQVYESVEKGVRSNAFKARAALAAGEVHLKYLKDTQRAEVATSRVLSQYKNVTSEVLRRARILLGDVRCYQGDYDAAIAEYTKAAKIAVAKRDYAQEVVAAAALARAVDDYIRRGELETARELLEIWEWEFPEDKLTGQTSILWAKVLGRLKDYKEALDELTVLLRVNPKSQFAPEALLLSADCYLQLKNPAEARKALEKIITDYPESPLAAEAVKKITEIKK